MGCTSTKQSDAHDTGVVIEYSDKQNNNIKQQPIGFSLQSRPAPALTFLDLFQQLDAHLAETELELWYRASELFFETPLTSDESILDRVVNPSEEAILRKAFFSVEVTMDNIKQLNTKRLLETKKESDAYLALLRYKVTKNGWLIKLGSIRKTWKKRYFVLSEGVVKYYEQSLTEDQLKKSGKPKGEIKLKHDTKIEESVLSPSKFTLLDANNNVIMHIDADDENIKFDWLEALSEHIEILKICDARNINDTNFLYYLRLADKIFKLRLASNVISGVPTVQPAAPSRTYFSHRPQNITAQILLDSLKNEGANLGGILYEEWLSAIGVYYKCNATKNDCDSAAVSQQILTQSQIDVIKKSVVEVTFDSSDIYNLDSKLVTSQELLDFYLGSNRFKLQTQGWLRKEGHIVRNWKKRFFVMGEGKMRYYENDDFKQMKGEVKFSPKAEVSSTSFDSKIFTLKLNDVGDTYLTMEGDTLAEKFNWMENIKEQIAWLASLESHNVDESNILTHFRIAEKVLKLHVACAGRTPESLLGLPVTCSGDVCSPTQAIQIVDEPPKQSRLAALASIVTGTSIQKSLSTFTSHVKGQTLGDLLVNINNTLTERGSPSLTRSDVDIWAIAIGLHLEFNDSTSEPLAQWQDRPVSDSVATIITTAICDINVSDNEFESEDVKQIQKSGKLSEQLVFLLRHQATTKGWLMKEGHFMRNIKKRYFVLSQGYLRYYEKSIQEPPYGVGLKGEVKLTALSRLEMLVNADGKPLKSTQFILYEGVSDEDSETASVVESKRAVRATSSTYLLMEVSDAESRSFWVDAIQEQIFIAGLFDKFSINPTNLLHYTKLSEKLLALYMANRHNSQPVVDA